MKCVHWSDSTLFFNMSLSKVFRHVTWQMLFLRKDVLSFIVGFTYSTWSLCGIINQFYISPYREATLYSVMSHDSPFSVKWRCLEFYSCVFFSLSMQVSLQAFVIHILVMWLLLFRHRTGNKLSSLNGQIWFTVLLSHLHPSVPVLHDGKPD